MAIGGSIVGTAKVVLGIDNAQFDRGFKQSHTQFREGVNQIEQDSARMSRGILAGSGAFEHLGRSIAFASGTFLGAAGFTSIIRDSIGAASDLHEQMEKVNIVFGTSAKQVEAWSATTDKSLGIAGSQALAFAGTFGNMLVPMGIARDRAADMSTSLVKLAADMASFNNANPEDVLKALQSGLAGQIRPLREYGVFLDQTRIKAEALRLGLLHGAVDQQKVVEATTALDIAQAKLTDTQKRYGAGTTQVAQAQLQLEKAHDAVAKATAGVTGQLTAAQKAQATYAIIVNDTKDAQGDFARTSGGLANQTRILHAEITTLEEKIGAALLPTVLEITKAVTGWLSKSKNQEEVTHDLHVAIGGLATVVKTLHEGWSDLSKVFGGSENTIKAIGVAFAGWKLAGLISSLRAVRLGLLGLGSVETLGAVAAAAVALQQLQDSNSPTNRAIHDSTANAPELPVYRNGKWVNPATGQPVADQAYWNRQFHQSNPGITVPHQGSNAYGPAGTDVTSGAGQHAGLRTRNETVLPETFSPTHQTSGLPDFPALDVFAVAGTPIGAPEDGTLLDPHFIPWNLQQRVGGWTCYFAGHESGDTYFLTHFGTINGAGFYKKGDIVGTVARVPQNAWQAHIHEGKHPGAYTPPGTSTRGSSGTTGTSPPNNVSETPAGTVLTVGHTPKKPPKPKAPPLISPKYGELIDAAALTRGPADDIKAYNEAITAVEKAIGQTKKGSESRARLEKLLKQYTDARDKLAAPIVEKEIAKATPKIGSLAGIETTMKNLQSGSGTKLVNIPGMGRVLVAIALTPTVAAWQKVLKQLQAKYKAAQARITSLQRSLAKARKARFPNQTLIAWLKQQIATAQGLATDMKRDAATALSEINQLKADAKAKVQQDAQEAEDAAQTATDQAEAGASDLPTSIQQLGANAALSGSTADQQAYLQAADQFYSSELATGHVAGQPTLALTPEARVAVTNALADVRQQEQALQQSLTDQQNAAAAAATQAANDALTTLPVGLQLQLARAQGTTGDTTDDLAAYRAQQAFLQGNLGKTSDQSVQLTIVQELNDIQSQIDGILNNQGTQIGNQQTQIGLSEQVSSFLSGERQIRTYESNILKSGFAGGDIHLHVTSMGTEPDALQLAQSLQFEIGSL